VGWAAEEGEGQKGMDAVGPRWKEFVQAEIRNTPGIHEDKSVGYTSGNVI
jgi:hypothetical protein